MNNSLQLSSFTLAPMWPIPVILSLTVVGLALIIARPARLDIRVLYSLALFSLTILMLNPQQIRTRSEAIARTLPILVDHSRSNTLSDRASKTEKALAQIQERLSAFPYITPLIVDIPTTPEGETHLFEHLNETMLRIPSSQRAGAILITDGVSHDAPTSALTQETYGPLHVVLTGSAKDQDTRLTLTEAPGYGLTGKTVRINIQLDHDGPTTQTHWPITLRAGESVIGSVEVGNHQSASFDVPITQAGLNVFLAETPFTAGDITSRNNQLPITIQGVRDRLKVLLVSAEPYIGGRMWRNMLTADAGVDLVHFTILRKPESIDPTPSSQMALIPFPFEELFDARLPQFDLVILDRYRADTLMPNRYLDNIADYVQKGGGLLDVSGIDYAGENSIAHTKLKDVLPVLPDGQVIHRSFVPQLTEQGSSHPVTAGMLQQGNGASPSWGPWTLQISGQSVPGAQVLMSGVDGRPLLTLARVKEGRVAQLSSDQIWLWARGYQRGGPYQELLRPLLHWLLKEPDLEEESLTADVQGDHALIRRRTLLNHLENATLTSPDGAETSLPLVQRSPGLYEAQIRLDAPGLYRVTSNGITRIFSASGTNVPEDQRVIPDEKVLEKTITRATGGAFIHLEKNPDPLLRPMATRSKWQKMGGDDWIGVPNDAATRITGVDQAPLLPPFFWLIVAGGLVALAWVRDGRSPR